MEDEGYIGFSDKREDWKTIEQVHASLVRITDDMVGEEVAIDVPYEEDWVYGTVISIGSYEGARHVRFQKLKTLIIEDDSGRRHEFKQEVITQLLFKEQGDN